MTEVLVSKDPDNEVAVPSIWRQTLKAIVDNLVIESSITVHPAHSILPMDATARKISLENIRDYDDKIGPLNSSSWETSISQWMEGYWDLLVDLSDLNGETVDLTLGIRIKEKDGVFQFEPKLVYVP